MTYVLDASVAASWCYQDEADSRADVARDLLITGRAFAPLHWWFELRNGLLVGERRGRISPPAMVEFLKRMARARIELMVLPSGNDVFAVARKHRLTFYDAAYLELAIRERVALATLDDKLATAAQAEHIPLVGVS